MLHAVSKRQASLSAVSILNLSERVSLQKFPPGGLFSHIYRPKTIEKLVLKYNMDPFSIFRERRRNDDSCLRKPEDDKIVEFSKKFQGGRLIRAIRAF